MKKIYPLVLSLISLILISCGGGSSTPPSGIDSSTSGSATSQPTLEEVRAIAKEAYLYAYPMVDGYRIHYAYFVAKDNPEYKAPYNTLYNTARVYTPADKAVQTPNSDTPYSFCGFDLRSEPYVLTIPEMEKDRYFSVQLIDYYTHNFDYIGSRTTGNNGGKYLIVGPNWKGETPQGISKVIRCETELMIALIRTQLFNPADLEKVKKIQAGYAIQPLSAYLGQPAPEPKSTIDFVNPLSPEQIKSSLEVFNLLNFQLQFCPTDSSEISLIDRFAKIGIGAGKNIDTTLLSPEIKTAMKKGIADAWTEFTVFKSRIDAKEITSGDLFGNRTYLKNNYLYRMGGAIVGIFGNSKEEAMYPIYAQDEKGNPLSGENQYVLRFAPGQLPPANSFWSLTMYEMPTSLLVDNPLNRYLINSPMLPQLKKDADGGITLYIQNHSPGKDKESNWLPSPKGSFMVVARIYWPKEEAISGKWSQPPLTKVN
jgi:hypothetical protein